MPVNIIEREVTAVSHDLFELHPVLQKIFLSRGISLKTELEKEIARLEPFSKLLNINIATEILYNNLINHKKIVIIARWLQK